jgi:hypothetical protein
MFQISNDTIVVLSLYYCIFCMVIILEDIVVQWAPLNGITLGPRQTIPINRMIPLTKRTLV